MLPSSDERFFIRSHSKLFISTFNIARELSAVDTRALSFEPQLKWQLFDGRHVCRHLMGELQLL